MHPVRLIDRLIVAYGVLNPQDPYLPVVTLADHPEWTMPADGGLHRILGRKRTRGDDRRSLELPTGKDATMSTGNRSDDEFRPSSAGEDTATRFTAAWWTASPKSGVLPRAGGCEPVPRAHGPFIGWRDPGERGCSTRSRTWCARPPTSGASGRDGLRTTSTTNVSPRWSPRGSGDDLGHRRCRARAHHRPDGNARPPGGSSLRVVSILRMKEFRTRTTSPPAPSHG